MTDKIPFTFTALRDAQRINGGKGAVVHMRNGGVIEVTDLTFERDDIVRDKTSYTRWYEGGCYTSREKIHGFDLTHITPAPTPKRLSGFVAVYEDKEGRLRFGGVWEHTESAESFEREGNTKFMLDLSRLAHENDDGSFTPITEGFGI